MSKPIKIMRKRSSNGTRKTKTPEHSAWNSMHRRCSNPKCESYSRYGGRGISVCKRWRLLENFLKDMGPKPSHKHSLDRKNNNKGYCPSNCRWATPKEQSLNKRNSIKKWKVLKIKRLASEGHSTSEIARKVGLSQGSVWKKLYGPPSQRC